jgi:sugar phosphate isomerase/epimerase
VRDESATRSASPVKIPSARIALSTGSVYPESAATGFELASRLGYDAVEIMVGVDPISQDIGAITQLVDYHGIEVCAIHAPCLLITQRVWGTEPWEKLRRSAEMAIALGADTVVVHPPFRWQRDYASGFIRGIAELEAATGVAFGVENMYPWRASRRELQAYAPGWNPVDEPYANVTIDLSHSSTAGSDPMEMVDRLGPRLKHVHMTDGTGSAKDEHLIPGHGNQPCAELLEELAARGFPGSIVLEINTRRATTRAARQADLAEALAFTRLHFAAADPGFAGSTRRSGRTGESPDGS